MESAPGKEAKRTRGGAGRGQPGDIAAKDLEIERLEGKLAEAHRSLQEQERLVSAYLHHCSHVQPVIWEEEAEIGRGSSGGGGAGVGVPLGEGAERAGRRVVGGGHTCAVGVGSSPGAARGQLLTSYSSSRHQQWGLESWEEGGGGGSCGMAEQLADGEGKDVQWEELEGSRVGDAEGAHEVEEESGLIGVGRVLTFSPVKAGHRAKHVPAAGEGAAVHAEPESSWRPPGRAVRDELTDVRWGTCHVATCLRLFVIACVHDLVTMQEKAVESHPSGRS
jgi:hypothetical protein